MTVQKSETGILALDYLLSGGIEKNKVFLISGGAKTGKTVFCLQFINRGLEQGQNAVYAITSGRPGDLFAYGDKMGWNLRRYNEDGKLAILDLSPYVSTTGQLMLSAKEMFTLISKTTGMFKANRLVIDSLDLLLGRDNAPANNLEYLKELISLIEEGQICTTVVTSGVSKVLNQTNVSSLLESIVKEMIYLTFEEETNQHWMTLKRVDKQGVSLTKQAYLIEDMRGITIELSPSETSKSLKIGQEIPHFNINAYQNAKEIVLDSLTYRGKWLVVLFYPGDFTFVCPTELEALADNQDKFTALDAEVMSISMDGLATHRAWYDSSPAIGKIRYPMGSDPTRGGMRSVLFVLSRQANCTSHLYLRSGGNPKGYGD